PFVRARRQRPSPPPAAQTPAPRSTATGPPDPKTAPGFVLRRRAAPVPELVAGATGAPSPLAIPPRVPPARATTRRHPGPRGRSVSLRRVDATPPSTRGRNGCDAARRNRRRPPTPPTDRRLGRKAV